MNRCVRSRHRALLICWAAVTVIGACGGCVDVGGASDVPCLIVDDWYGFEAARLDQNGLLVITVQSVEDFDADRASGGLDFIPHQDVYRYDPVTGAISAVDDKIWDDSVNPVSDCCLYSIEVGGFVVSGSQLYFDGAPVALAGWTIVKMVPTAADDRIAVLSTNGLVTFYGNSTGQHYHQLFSVETGEQIGPTLRLGVGGYGHGGTSFFWSDDDRFVIYYEILDAMDPMDVRLCTVDTERIGE